MKLIQALVTTLCICFAIPLQAQELLGVIHDPDGFVHVRSGQDKGAPIIDTLFSDDLFYFPRGYHHDWVKIKVLVLSGKEIEGYMHVTRIKEFRHLDLPTQRERILKVLDMHRDLADAFQTAVQGERSPSYAQARHDLELHSEARYDPVLMMLPSYLRWTMDTVVLQRLFATMWADKGSANETPGFILGQSYVENPELVIRSVEKLESLAQKKHLFGQIEWHLLNLDEQEAIQNADVSILQQLMERLERAKREAGL